MWFSVRDGLPPLYQDVLVYDDYIYAVASYYGDDCGGWGSYSPIETVQYWAFLPPLTVKDNAKQS